MVLDGYWTGRIIFQPGRVNCYSALGKLSRSSTRAVLAIALPSRVLEIQHGSPLSLEPIEHPVIRCQHCEDTRQYLDKDSFLAPLSAGSSDKSGGMLLWLPVDRCGQERIGPASIRMTPFSLPS
jgi:hypothetical protein